MKTSISSPLAPLAPLAAMALLGAPPAQAAVTYSIDPTHSEVSFQVRHLLTQVRGRFGAFSGTIHLDPERLEASSVEFRIEAASVDTLLPERDKHLRSPDFFDAEKFPEIIFHSRQVRAAGKDRYEVRGTLTLRGVSREIALPVTYLGAVRDPWGNVKAGFETSCTLARKDFGMVWNMALDNGGVILGDEVRVNVNLEAVEVR